MPRITLPGEDQWVEFIDPEQITRRHIRQVRIAMGAGDSLTESLELGVEKVLEVSITNWTLTKPIPGDGKGKDALTILDSLDRPTWYALEKAAKDFMTHFGDPAAQESEGDPQKPSDE